MQARVNESDWKLFRRKMIDWQEVHMRQLNQKYIELLSAQAMLRVNSERWKNVLTGIRKV